MTKRLVLAVLLLLTTAGCTGYHKQLDGNPPFSAHNFRYYDVEVTWRTELSDGKMRLSGTVNNLRSYFLRDLELTARLLDKQGKILARETYASFPTYLPSGKVEPFVLEFSTPPNAQVERIHFSYIYWLAEEPPAFRGYDDTPYFGNFVSPP